MPVNKVRLDLDVSPELDLLLSELATKMHGTKSDVLRKAIALIEVAVRAKDHGQRLGIIDKEYRVVSEIVGL